PAEISFVVTDCDGTELFASTGTEGCMPALPETGTVTLSDSYGDGGSDYGGDVLTIGGVVIYNSEVFTDTWSTSLGVCPVYGCTDATACNYDAAADTDDGSCTTALLVTTEVCAGATEVRMTGPWWNWDPAGGPIAADNGDGTWTFTFCPAPTADMEFLLVVDGVQENLVNAPHPDIDGDGYGDLWGCAPITDYFSYANRLWIDGSGDVTNTYGTCGSCSDVYGCMDVSASNYDASANVMDYAACTYPTVSNDLIGGAELLTMTAFGTCTSVSGTTAGASDSPESVNLWGGAYIDVWYEIVPTEAGVRIAVVTSSMDCMLELLDDQGDLVETADVNLSGEGEILFSNLTPGNSYFLSVQDYNNVGGTFEICAQELPASEVYGPNVGQVYPCSGYRGLSSTTSVSVAGGGTDWTFDDGVNTPITYSTQYSSVNLDVVPGLQSGTTYAVSIVPHYNGFGVTSQGTNEITIGAPSTGLKTQYINSTVALAQYSYVRCLQNTACSYESFDWRITDVNTGMVSNVNTPGDLLFLSAVTDITYASEYTAEIAVVYDDGNVGEYSAPQTFFTGAVPVTELRSIFNSSNTTLTQAQDISATPKVYLAADYEWYVQRVDVTEIPFVYVRGLAVRVARVNQMPLAAGGTYNLSVRPIVPGAVTEFGPAQEVVVIGGAGMVQDDEETSPEIAEETVIKDNLISASVTMYPNPANDFVTLNITGIAEGTDKVLVDIFNTVGQLVQSEQIPADGNYVNSVVTLNGLAEGMYNVQITVGNTVSSERMIIQK
ncbi:MAG: T9SS type A sorting domain-containing protein, partial [Flavobacteriales bacterium]